MNVLKNYLKFILWQDIEKTNKKKKSSWLYLFIRYAFALFFTWGIYYISGELNLSKPIRIIFVIYGVLSILATAPCYSIQLNKDGLEGWLPSFGRYNSLSTFVAPIYLLKYCIDLEKNKEN